MANDPTILFISHASPEDNQFAGWLSLQLGRRGYSTWCDVNKLLGGEPWWKDIETAITKASCKFIIVCSTRSVKKNGVIRELKLAQQVLPAPKNFVIPIRLDGVSYKDFPESIGSELNAVDFSNGWAAGLSRLLERLEEDGAPKIPGLDASTINEFWRKSFPAQEGVKSASEVLTSNWLLLKLMPEFIWIHTASGFASSGFNTKDLPHPAEKYGERLVTFSQITEFNSFLRKTGMRVRASEKINLHDFLKDGSRDHSLFSREARNFVRSMFRVAWDKNALFRGFKMYELANQDVCFWMEKGFSKGDEVEFVGIDGKKQKRQLVGYKSYHVEPGADPKQRFWHFAVQGRPLLWPFQMFAIRTHVVFTEDGKNLIDSSARQHSARRSQCKSWWNDTWRDRLLAAVSALKDPSGDIILKLSDSAEAHIATFPKTFESTVSYSPTETVHIEDIPVADEIDEEDGFEEEVKQQNE